MSNRTASLITVILCLAFMHKALPSTAQEDLIKPDETFKFATRDTCDLFLDVYYPADGSDDTFNGARKPTVLFMFGGGFKEGTRDGAEARRWFRMLTDAGYTVTSIDYRLGLKNANKAGVAQALEIHSAIKMAVEDLFSATRFIIDNAEKMDIEADKLIITGSSAGAISVMQAEWELCNKSEMTAILPDDFKYAGVISFAGAVFSKKGAVRYRSEPAPTLMFHGTADRIVNYRQIRVLNLAFEGDGRISREFRKKGYNYNIFRYEGNGHEIASVMVRTFPDQIRFIEENILEGKKRILDAKVKDPSIKSFSIKNRKQLYGDTATQ